jgi:carbonic anhydrase/acetyltransferase-like protein (isoleucine patch superfamily)
MTKYGVLGATIFNGARIGRRAEVRINGIVHLRTMLPQGATVPLGWIAIGDPTESCPCMNTSGSGRFRAAPLQ